jgi:hypothetical protein
MLQTLPQLWPASDLLRALTNKPAHKHPQCSAQCATKCSGPDRRAITSCWMPKRVQVLMCKCWLLSVRRDASNVRAMSQIRPAHTKGEPYHWDFLAPSLLHIVGPIAKMANVLAHVQEMQAAGQCRSFRASNRSPVFGPSLPSKRARTYLRAAQTAVETTKSTAAKATASAPALLSNAQQASLAAR